MSRLRIATRASTLALAQSRWVAERLTEAHPELEVELVEITTTGDADRISSVTTLTEVGAFVRSVQVAVLDGSADLAVHSCKDLPVSGPEELVAFFPEREVPWDVMCGSTVADLRPGARVGTGSPRRTAQLAAMRPDLEIDGIRGNVETRLAKVDSREYDAIVLAEAGLRRIGLEGAISERFTVERMVPAPAQGALAVEARQESEAAELLASIDHPPTRTEVEAERSLLARTGAGCRAALGALAVTSGEDVEMHGFVEDADGPRRANVVGSTAEIASRRLQEELGL
ncbi:MAG: hydroxymethylbilane synthase [Acidimicrobiia bacterium]|nr:hydroxymethylbilane synthase [Acidimicrobiia bacterium]